MVNGLPLFFFPIFIRSRVISLSPPSFGPKSIRCFESYNNPMDVFGEALKEACGRTAPTKFPSSRRLERPFSYNPE